MEISGEKLKLQQNQFFESEIFWFCFCLVYIVLFCWTGFYARPQADDYTMAFNVANSSSFLAFQVHFYQSWSGGILGTFLQTTAYLFPFSVYPLWPLLNILLYTVALVFLLHSFVPELQKKLGIALLFTTITLAFCPAFNEILYWLCGMGYFWSTIFLMLNLGFAVRALRGSKRSFWIGLALFFLDGTLGAPSCVFQGVVAFCGALWFLWHKDKKRSWICVAFWLVSCGAFLVMYLAPGTSGRMGNYAAVPVFSRLVRMFAAAAAFGGITVLKFFIKPLTWIFFLFLPSFQEKFKITEPRFRGWQIFAIVILLAPFMHAISGWAQGGGLPPRGESLLLWMMGVIWVFLWTFCHKSHNGQDSRVHSKKFSKLFAWRWALLLLALVLNSNFINLVYGLGSGSAFRYAAEWDSREVDIINQRDAGNRDIAVSLLTERPALLYFDDLGVSSSDWKNVAAAKFYGVDSVFALPSVMRKDSAAVARLMAGDVSDLQSLAEKGNDTAAFLMGTLYDWLFADFGNIKKSDAEAIQWYQKAVELGNREAVRMQLHLYSRNNSASNRLIQTLTWFLRSQIPSLLP